MMVHQGAAAGNVPTTAAVWPPAAPVAAWPLQGVPDAAAPPPPPPQPQPQPQPSSPPRKRKAETQDNERLSKRLSLLNIEQNGSKLYVPVESPPPPPSCSDAVDDTMHVDDSKHKVYIYDIDDELASSDDDDARLVFLPDIQRHLRDNRIPPHVLANPDGELAGMQMVVYSDPRSLTVPEEHDGVRRAILDARRRVRERQRQARDCPDTPAVGQASVTLAVDGDGDVDAMEVD